MHRSPTKVLLVAAAFALFLVPVAAVAAAGFTDVADDSIFVADIQWMKDNGITKGCNPPANDRFCPGNNVTREQMSAFMHRLSISQVVDAATAVEADNADTLDGIDSDAFLPNGTPPVGTTVRGNYALGGGSGTAEWAWSSISWGFEMPGAPTVHWLTAGSSPTTDCPGTPANPQAAPGHLCVYEKSALNAAHYEFVGGGTDIADTADTFGVVLHVEDNTLGEYRSLGTWAITVGTP